MHEPLARTTFWIAVSKIPAGGFERGFGRMSGVVRVIGRRRATAGVLVVFGTGIFFMTHCELV